MNADVLSSEFLSASNAIAAFAILQNIAFCYAMLKRELFLNLDGRYRWSLVGGAVLWNMAYMYGVYWCSWKAAELGRLPPELEGAFSNLVFAKLVAIGFVGACSVWLIIAYDWKHLWRRDEARA